MIISVSVTVLLPFVHRVWGKSDCRHLHVSSSCPWYKSAPFGNPFHWTSRGWIQAVKTRACELQSSSAEGLAQTNHPQRSWERYCISAATRLLHRSGFASGRAVVQQGSKGSCFLRAPVLQSKDCSVGSDLLKPPKHYLVIRWGGEIASLDCRLQEVLFVLIQGGSTEVFPTPHNPAHCS